MATRGKQEDGRRPSRLASEAATALLATMPLLARGAEGAARAAGALSPARVRMLMVLTDGSRRGSEIAAHWHISRAAVTTAAASLERQGYLRRVPDPDDRRAVRFALTLRGRRAMEKFGSVTARSLADHVGRLPPDAQEALRDASRALLASLAGESAGGTMRRR